MCIYMHKSTILAEKMPHMEDLLFSRDKVLSFSEKYQWIWKNTEKFRKVPFKAEEMPSKEELLFNMEKLLPVSEKWKNAIQWRFAIQLWKDSVCLKKMKKRAILSRKRSSKEELLFNMENVPSVSKSAIDNEKISYNERAQKCHPKRKKCHPRKSIIYNKKDIIQCP